jgi:hypothetical protein
MQSQTRFTSAVRDHQNVRAQNRDLAKSLRVTPTPPRDFALAKAHGVAMLLDGLK